MSWSSPSCVEPRLGPHAHRHPQWRSRLQSRLAALGDVDTWQQRWIQLQGAFVDTVDEVSRLPRIDTSNAATSYWTALRALRLFQQGRTDMFHKLVRSCVGWAYICILPETRQIRTLCSLLAESLQELMQQELDEPADDDCDDGKRKQFLSKALTLWKQKRFIGPPSVLGADAVHDEVGLLTDHWQPLFENTFHSDRSRWENFSTWLPPIAWPHVPLDVGRMASLLGLLPKTACGPDGISYAMLASAPAWSAPLLIEALSWVLSGRQLPESWSDAFLVLLPKKDGSALPPSSFRPLALGNTMLKVLARYVLFHLQSTYAQLHPIQNGFIPDRSISIVIGRLEQAAHIAATTSRESCLLLCDYKNAFGSMSRSWILHCLRARGMQGQLLCFMTELLRPSSLFLRWRGDCKHVIRMVEGTPQGGPLSPWFFLVGLDPLLRYLASHLHPLDLLSAWADDLAAETIDFRSLSMIYDAVVRFTLVSGLALQLP
eukprot:436650-Amphidinium_carterae.1